MRPGLWGDFPAQDPNPAVGRSLAAPPIPPRGVAQRAQHQLLEAPGRNRQTCACPNLFIHDGQWHVWHGSSGSANEVNQAAKNSG